MDSAEFISLGQKITGIKRGYQIPLAKRIGKSRAMIKRYAAGDPIPETVQILMKELGK